MTRPSDSGASGVDWGAPIPVDGKPAWLRGDEIAQCHWKAEPMPAGWSSRPCVASEFDGSYSHLDFIRLPVNHVHYRNLKFIPREAPQPADTVTVGRMEALVRRLAAAKCGTWPEQDEARAIVALLDPVDPDLAEVEALLSEHQGGSEPPCRRVALAAIKRGRALATAEKALAWGEGE